MATAEAQQSQETNMSSQSESSHHKDAFIDFMGGVAGRYLTLTASETQIKTQVSPQICTDLRGDKKFRKIRGISWIHQIFHFLFDCIFLNAPLMYAIWLVYHSYFTISITPIYMDPDSNSPLI